MKSLRDRSTGTQVFPRNWAKSFGHNAWILLLPMLIIACGGSLGKIQVENVDAIITESDAALEQARLANAQALAPEVLQEAESAVESAKEAVKAKNGLEAIRLAYNALVQARGAEQEAMYKSQEEGLNAIIKRKEVEIVEFQANLRTADAKLEKARTEIQRLDMQRQLQAKMDRKVREVERDRQKTLRDYSTAKTELEQLQSRLNTTKAQFLQAQTKVEEHERQTYQLRRELALSQSMVEEARKKATESQAKARTQSQSYSKQIQQLDQSNLLKQREKALTRKKQEARSYVQRQEAREPDRTKRTPLSNEHAKGKLVLNDWHLAWKAKDTIQHLSEYVQDVTVERIDIRSSSEKRTYLNRTQMVDALKERVNVQWGGGDAKFETDGESVVGTYRFSRRQNVASGNLPELYDVWTREVWVRQVGNKWKIFREVWRIYEDVPKYATVFN